MTKVPRSEAAILRQKAVELLNRKKQKSGLGSPKNESEMQRLIHELEVHQIELEMQNDELLRAKEEAEISFRKYIELKENVSTEEELQKNNLRFELALRAAKMAWWTMDLTTGNVIFGRRKAEMLGFSPEKFKHYTDFTALVHPEDLERTMNAMQRHLDGSIDKYEIEYRILTKSNGYIWFYDIGSVVKKDTNGKPVLITGLVIDISDRKQVELALHNSEAHLRTLIQTIPDMIWLKDTNGVYLSCNTMFERFFGAKVGDIIGKTDYDFVDQELADFFRENDRKAIAADKPTSNEEWVTFADDGHRAFLETIKTPMYDSDRTLIGVLGIGRDISERKLNEQIVQDSEKRFKAIFDQAPIAIALINMQGFPIISNLPLSKMLGYSSDELSKMKFTEFTYPPDINKDMDQFTDLINGKISKYTMEKRYIHKNGNIIWANLFVTTLCDKSGLISEIIGMVEDITERKNSEKEVLMLAHSLKSINECVSITDLDNKIIFVNESFLKTYGYNLNELIGKNISIVRSLANEQKTIDEILPATILGEWQGELLNRRKDGSEFPIYLSTTIIKNKDSNPLGLIGVAKDITDRKNADETLLKLSSAVEQTGDSIMITDPTGTIEYVNHAFEVLTGYSFKEAVGKTPRILKSGASENEYYELMWKTILSGKIYRAEVVNKKKNGDLYNEEKTISPIFNQDKTITHFIGTGVDITRRKLAEKELIEAKEKAEESDRLKSAFLANMSHEVRTPLNSIIGFSELLADPDFNGDQRSEFIQHIIASGNNLLTIISDIMDISKLESGEIAIRRSQINVHKFISNVKEQFAIQVEGKKLELNLAHPDYYEEMAVFADAERLKQIFNNLMSNAIKFTMNGSVEIGYHPKGEMVEFYVKDTGIGIPAEFHDTIFERFRQVEAGSSRKYGGNGLGLAISKSLVELMGGKIWLESESGVGTVFYFTLPVFQCVNHTTN